MADTLLVWLTDPSTILRRPRGEVDAYKPLDGDRANEVPNNEYWRRRLLAKEIVLDSERAKHGVPAFKDDAAPASAKKAKSEDR